MASSSQSGNQNLSSVSTSNIPGQGNSGQRSAKTIPRATSAKYYDIASTILGGNGDVVEVFLNAAKNGNIAKLEQLLQQRNEVNLDIDCKDKRTGNTALIWAAKRGHSKTVEMLLRHGADPTLCNYDAQTAIELAFSPTKTVLLDWVETCQDISLTLLLQAAWQGNLAVVRRVLENKPSSLDVNGQNPEGLTPLMLVSRDVQLFERLSVQLGRHYNPVEVAAELMKSNANIHVTDNDGRSSLHYASQSRAGTADKLVSTLVSGGMDIELKDKRYFTPIHLASQLGNTHNVVALLDGGSEVNVKGFAGLTPLHMTAYNDHQKTAVTLLNYGADVRITDDRGLTPLDLAKTRRMKNTLKEAWAESEKEDEKQGEANSLIVKVPTEEAKKKRNAPVKKRPEVIFDNLVQGPSKTSTPAQKNGLKVLSNVEKCKQAERKILEEVEALKAAHPVLQRETTRMLGTTRSKILPEIGRSSSPEHSHSPDTVRSSLETRRSLEDGRNQLMSRGRTISDIKLSTNEGRQSRASPKRNPSNSHNNRNSPGNRHQRSGSDPIAHSLADIAASCDTFLPNGKDKRLSQKMRQLSQGQEFSATSPSILMTEKDREEDWCEERMLSSMESPFDLLRCRSILKEEFVLEESRPRDIPSGSDPASSTSTLSSSSPRDLSSQRQSPTRSLRLNASLTALQESQSYSPESSERFQGAVKPLIREPQQRLRRKSENSASNSSSEFNKKDGHESSRSLVRDKGRSQSLRVISEKSQQPTSSLQTLGEAPLVRKSHSLENVSPRPSASSSTNQPPQVPPLPLNKDKDSEKNASSGGKKDILVSKAAAKVSGDKSVIKDANSNKKVAPFSGKVKLIASADIDAWDNESIGTGRSEQEVKQASGDKKSLGRNDSIVPPTKSSQEPLKSHKNQISNEKRPSVSKSCGNALTKVSELNTDININERPQTSANDSNAKSSGTAVAKNERQKTDSDLKKSTPSTRPPVPTKTAFITETEHSQSSINGQSCTASGNLSSGTVSVNSSVSSSTADCLFMITEESERKGSASRLRQMEREALAKQKAKEIMNQQTQPRPVPRPKQMVATTNKDVSKARSVNLAASIERTIRNNQPQPSIAPKVSVLRQKETSTVGSSVSRNNASSVKDKPNTTKSSVDVKSRLSSSCTQSLSSSTASSSKSQPTITTTVSSKPGTDASSRITLAKQKSQDKTQESQSTAMSSARTVLMKQKSQDKSSEAQKTVSSQSNAKVTLTKQKSQEAQGQVSTPITHPNPVTSVSQKEKSSDQIKDSQRNTSGQSINQNQTSMSKDKAQISSQGESQSKTQSSNSQSSKVHCSPVDPNIILSPRKNEPLVKIKLSSSSVSADHQTSTSTVSKSNPATSEVSTPVIVNPFENFVQAHIRATQATTSTPDAVVKLRKTVKPSGSSSTRSQKKTTSSKRPNSGSTRQTSAGKKAGTKSKDAKSDKEVRPKSTRKPRGGSSKKRKGKETTETEMSSVAEKADVALISGIGWQLSTSCIDKSNVKANGELVLDSSDSANSEDEDQIQTPKPMLDIEETNEVTSEHDHNARNTVLEVFKEKITMNSPRFLEMKRRQESQVNMKLPSVEDDGFPPMNLDMTQQHLSEEQHAERSNKMPVQLEEDDFIGELNSYQSNRNGDIQRDVLMGKLTPITEMSLLSKTSEAISNFDRSVHEKRLEELLGNSEMTPRNDPDKEGNTESCTFDKDTEGNRKNESVKLRDNSKKTVIYEYTSLGKTVRRAQSMKEGLNKPSPSRERKFSETKDEAANAGDENIDEVIEEILSSTTSSLASTLRGHEVSLPRQKFGLSSLTDGDRSLLLKLKNTNSPFYARGAMQSLDSPKQDIADLSSSSNSKQIQDIASTNISNSVAGDVRMKGSMEELRASTSSITDKPPKSSRVPRSKHLQRSRSERSTLERAQPNPVQITEEEAKQLAKVMNSFRHMELHTTDTATAENLGGSAKQLARTSHRGSLSGKSSSAGQIQQRIGSLEVSLSKKGKFHELKEGLNGTQEIKSAGKLEQGSAPLVEISKEEENLLEKLVDIQLDPKVLAEVGPIENIYQNLSLRRGSLAGSECTVDSVKSREETIQWKKGNVLGKGAFGIVWCGLTNEGQLIAVKQIELTTMDTAKAEHEYEKIQEEVELLKTLEHMNIVGYLGTSLEDNIVSIFMQFIPGGSLASILARFGALDESVFRRYTRQILEGVEYLHDNDVIHRDLKGANVMLMPNGVIKLIDFGCAKRLCINLSLSETEILKSMKGTPFWMAPEVVNETGHGKKSDIWSIGCTVFEMATRKPPWAEMNPMAAIFAIGSAVRPVPTLPEKFSLDARQFVSDCLTRDQDKRPSASELLEHEFITRKNARKNSTKS